MKGDSAREVNEEENRSARCEKRGKAGVLGLKSSHTLCTLSSISDPREVEPW